MLLQMAAKSYWIKSEATAADQVEGWGPRSESSVKQPFCLCSSVSFLQVVFLRYNSGGRINRLRAGNNIKLPELLALRGTQLSPVLQLHFLFVICC